MLHLFTGANVVQNFRFRKGIFPFYEKLQIIVQTNYLLLTTVIVVFF